MREKVVREYTKTAKNAFLKNAPHLTISRNCLSVTPKSF